MARPDTIFGARALGPGKNCPSKSFFVHEMLNYMISRKRLLFTAAVSGILLGFAGCSGLFTKSDNTPAPVLSGDWKGDLTIPLEFSSNRGMSDTTCDRLSGDGQNLVLSLHSTAASVNVSGHLQCSLRGKKVYSHDLPSTTLEVRGEDLILDGKTVGKATPVYFSANLPEGKLTVVKFPTWEKIYFENTTAHPEPLTLSGVFADRKTFADDEAPSSGRVPASD